MATNAKRILSAMFVEGGAINAEDTSDNKARKGKAAFPWLDEAKCNTREGFLSECEALYDALSDFQATGKLTISDGKGGKIEATTRSAKTAENCNLPQTAGTPLTKPLDCGKRTTLGELLASAMAYGFSLYHQTAMKKANVTLLGALYTPKKPAAKAAAAKASTVVAADDL